MINPNPKTALITGASGGIGLELAKLFARDRFNLVLVARSRDKLDQLAAELGKKYGVKTMVIAKDLSDHSSPQDVYEEVQKARVSVDILVNNAGYTMLGKFVELGVQEQMQMAQVNIMTLTQLTRLFLPGMVERGYGKILNMSSTAAFQPGPMMAVYYASKAYVLSFSEALANELRGTGVTVTALCPGPTRTGFQSRGNLEGIHLLRLGVMEAKPVARAGYKALMSGKTLLVPGTANWLASEAIRFMPRSLATRLVRAAHEGDTK